MAAPKQTDPQMKIRLTPELKARIEAAADENNRSMNAEIIARLEASFIVGAASTKDASRVNENLVYLVKKMTEFEVRLEELTAGRPDPWPDGRKDD